MNEYIDIIKTGIVSNECDSLWQDETHVFENAAPHTVIVISTPYLPAGEEASTLQNMLNACKLQQSSYHVLQLHQNQVIAWHKLRNAFMPKTLLLLGIEPTQLGITAQFPLNHPNHFDGCILIFSVAVNDFQKQPAIKAQLWNEALKPVFIDKKYGDI